MSEMIQLTLPQQDVYFEQLLFPNTPIYNIGAKIKIEGTLVVKIMQEAYRTLLQQHNTYRSCVDHTNDTISFVELESYDAVLEVKDFSNETHADAKANTFMQARFVQPFDLKTRGLLHKFILIKVAEEVHYLFSVYHHIITDGWGTSLMFQRLVTNYNELIAHGTVLTSYPFHYDAFVEDDAQYQQSEAYEKDKAYWKSRFNSLPEALFPLKKGIQPQHKSQRKALIIKRELYTKLEAIGKASRCSTFHVILGLMYVYFGRKQRNHDFAIGLPVLNRSKAIFKKTVGLFMGVSALRIQLEKEDTFSSFLTKIRQQLRQDFRYQRFPLGKLIQELELFHQNSRLFDITLSYEKQNYADHFANTKTSVIPLTHQSERVPLAIYIREFDPKEDVKIDFDYNTSYFDETSITQITTHFENLLNAVVQNPTQKIHAYSYLSASEVKEIVHTYNQTAFTYPTQKTVLDYIHKHIEKQPEKIALYDQNQTFTYKEIAELSDTIAKQIIATTSGTSNKPVAILLPRSAKLIVCMLGILKSKRPFIPLDPSFPEERLAYIISHSETDLIVGAAKELPLTTTVEKMDFASLITTVHTETTLPTTTAADSAYIIYTSGTTGNPKGVEIGHQALLNFILSIQERPGMAKNDLLYSVTTQSFDISILEFITPLLAGASVYVALQETLADPFAVLQELDEVSPTIIQATPSFYQLLFNAGWKGNAGIKILCGGDLLSKALAEKLLHSTKELWNMYGPTETTIWSTCKHITNSLEASTIGTPIHNTQVYILDDALQILPKQSIGTLYIGGHGLANGYYKNEALTAARFLTHDQLQKRIYNTGDLAKWNANGEIEFLGRDDFQVKIRGFRIELGDIEAKLNEIKGVKEAVVVAKKQQDQEAYLLAFVVADEVFAMNEVKNHLKTQLPSYMIPNQIVRLEALPLTPNKKVDRKALMAFQVQATNTVATSLQKATTSLQKTLCRLFQEVVGVAYEMYLADNFFEHGGHSLNAVKLINRIETELEYTLSLRTLFDHPTIAELADYIAHNSTEIAKEFIPKAAVQKYYPITEAQQEIWMASQNRERSIAYNMFAAYQIEGTVDLLKLQSIFAYLISKYEILRTNFVEVAGIPHQKIQNTNSNFHIQTIACTDEDIQTQMQDEVHKPFDLTKERLFKIVHFKRDTADFLVFNTHHSIMDGWSLELLIQEVAHCYSLENIPNEASTELFQFKDYALWQTQKNTEKHHEYWASYLEGYSWKPLLNTANSLQKEANQSASVHFEFNAELWQDIHDFTKAQKVTLHSFLATMFSVLVLKNDAHDDVCIGTVNAGRNHASLTSQLGMYVKTLPLRTRYEETQTVFSLLHTAQNDILDFDTHQDIPTDIRKEFLWDVVLVVQNQSFNYKTIQLTEQLSFTAYEIAARYSRLPLLLNFTVATTLSVRINYDSTLFDADSISLLYLRFEKLLTSAVAATAETTLEDLDIQLHQETSSDIDIDFNF
ncbi:dimodular nonribosomal peptide synthase [Kordia sp. SMS9]|uniref:non-ribosomal peptide synthetase n=1 Tax=Kordia sp. SMS9 TaxID=2282170 RepID=UPI000E0D26CE|nr:non-ribosomal peptide synthetase [Kordia sp. SMS9]AXG70739.1 dimodular nonribosomal peptide synthase [Kordia sp. SMS9]